VKVWYNDSVSSFCQEIAASFDTTLMDAENITYGKHSGVSIGGSNNVDINLVASESPSLQLSFWV
jgi:hypothetical protein